MESEIFNEFFGCQCFRKQYLDNQEFTYRTTVVSSCAWFFCPITVISLATASAYVISSSAIALMLILGLSVVVQEVAWRILAVIVVTGKSLLATLRYSFYAWVNANFILTRICLRRAHFTVTVALFVCRCINATLGEFLIWPSGVFF